MPTLTLDTIVQAASALHATGQHAAAGDFWLAALDQELAGTLIVDLGDAFQSGDWLDTAAVIANLDLVIAPCTGVAHLAGAMGKPVWLALSEPGCWRWGLGKKDEGGRMKAEQAKTAANKAGSIHPSSFILPRSFINPSEACGIRRCGSAGSASAGRGTACSRRWRPSSGSRPRQRRAESPPLAGCMAHPL